MLETKVKTFPLKLNVENYIAYIKDSVLRWLQYIIYIYIALRR